MATFREVAHQKRVEQKEQLRNALFSRYDQLNDRITKAEKRLAAFHVPHTVSLQYDTAGDETDHVYLYIAIHKIKGEWRLCHAIVEHEYLEPNYKPLVDCSAWERVRASKHLHKLEGEIVNACERFVPKVDEAVAELDKYLAS